jgi:hypothetical protein
MTAVKEIQLPKLNPKRRWEGMNSAGVSQGENGKTVIAIESRFHE